MSGRVLFLADIHLNPDEPGRHATFIEFLRREDAGRVYLIGDVFDYWIGPRHLNSRDYQVALQGLRALTHEGMKISFVPGNRDYFVEERFAAATGVTLPGEEVEMELGGRRVYLAHGDFLYNKNPKYTAYRRIMRFGMLRSAFLNLPGPIEKGLARGFRKVSVKTTPYAAWSSDELLDGAEKHFQRGIDVVIAGHIHQPCHLRHGGRDLFIVGDWGADGEYVEFDGSSFELKKALLE